MLTLWLAAVGVALSYRRLSRSSRDRYEDERHRAEWVDCYSTEGSGVYG